MASTDELDKFKKKIKEITGRENIIPGIHNYCDRWCERCVFVSRCSVGLMEIEFEGPGRDMNNKAFWEHLSMIFQATFEMLYEGAREMGIDLNTNVKEYEEPVYHESDIEKAAKEYGLRLIKWLEKNDDLFARKEDILKLTGEQQLVTYVDAVEVIRWYSLFISVKIHRAHLPPLDVEDEEIEIYDKTGSAKVAMIGISRSLEAFAVLYNHFPEQEDEILGFLADLSRIARLMKQSFPDAMNFKRPGFDD